MAGDHAFPDADADGDRRARADNESASHELVASTNVAGDAATDAAHDHQDALPTATTSSPPGTGAPQVGT